MKTLVFSLLATLFTILSGKAQISEAYTMKVVSGKDAAEYKFSSYDAFTLKGYEILRETAAKHGSVAPDGSYISRTPVYVSVHVVLGTTCGMTVTANITVEDNPMMIAQAIKDLRGQLYATLMGYCD